MAMQVEHKTEKGTVKFVLTPSVKLKFKIYSEFLVMGISEVDVKNKCIKIDRGDTKGFIKIGFGFQLIGLTSEITEEQAKMMVDSIGGTVDAYFKDYLIVKHSSKFQFACISALDSFKSLMQHLQVYETNPFGKNYNCNVYNGAGSFLNGKLYTMNEAYKGWEQAQSRTGKWIVLFKP